MVLNFEVRHIYFRHKCTSGSTTVDAIEQLDPENMGIAVGISFLALIEPDIPWAVKTVKIPPPPVTKDGWLNSIP